MRALRSAKGLTVFTLAISLLAVALLAMPAVTAWGAPEVEWQRFYGASNETAACVAKTADGGYILAGDSTSSGGGGDADVYLVKTDASGNVTWEKTIDQGGSESAACVLQTADGGYILAGTVSSASDPSLDAYILKTDESGNQQWDNSFGGAEDDQIRCIRETAGGYIVAGWTSSYGSGSSDAYLVKVDASGVPVWEKTFGGEGFDYAYCVRETGDGGYILAGATRPLASVDDDVYLIKTDASGDSAWEKTYGGENGDFAYCVEQASDGGYVLAGGTHSLGDYNGDAYLLKADGSGEKAWEKAFGGADNDYARCVRQTADGGYILAGWSASYGAGSYDAYLVKTDASGTPFWYKYLGAEGYDFAECVEQTADEGYVVAGYTCLGDDCDAWLAKLGPGNTPAGSGVEVDAGEGIALIFDSVEAGGDTAAFPQPDAQAANFGVLEGSCYEVRTTALYTGMVSVALPYDESQILIPEEDLRLLHYEDASWVDVTTHVDTLNDLVIGEVSALSPLAVGWEKRETALSYEGDYLAAAGQPVGLAASVFCDDGLAWDMALASPVVFEIRDSQGMVVEVEAAVTQTSPGRGLAEASAEDLAAGVYTLDVRLKPDNSYHLAGEVSAPVAVYDPGSRSVSGGGYIDDDAGGAYFAFDIVCRGRSFLFPRGRLVLDEIASENFFFVIIPYYINWAYVCGNCSYHGSAGYAFTMLAGDNDGGSGDFLHIVVYDSAWRVVYEAHGFLGGGNIEINR
jgi:hypothetical protein